MAGKLKKILLNILIIILSINIFSSGQAREPNLIPFETLKKAALMQAEKIYGRVRFYEAQEYKDLNGNLAAVVFTFYRKEGLLPDKELINEKADKYTKPPLFKRDLKEKGGREGSGPLQEKFKSNYASLARQADNFATVVMGATYQSPPFILMVDGLPRHLFLLPKARRSIESALGVRVNSISDFIYFQPYSFWIEFSTPYPGKRGNILINLQTFGITTRHELKKRYSQDRNRRPSKNLTGVKEEARQKYCLHKWKSLEHFLSRREVSDGRKLFKAADDDSDLRVQSRLKAEGEFQAAGPVIYDGYIPDVPNIHQTMNDCAAVAATQVLAYWGENGYPYLINGPVYPDKPPYFDLTLELRQAMGWSIEDPPKAYEVRSGIEEVCNSPEYNNNYNFQVHLDDWYPLPQWEDLTAEIDAGRPLMIVTIDYVGWPYPYGTHGMCVVGYYEGYLAGANLTSKWAIVHDNFWPDDDVSYVDWNIATDCIIRIIPGGGAFPATRKNIDKKIREFKDGEIFKSEVEGVIDKYMVDE